MFVHSTATMETEKETPPSGGPPPQEPRSPGRRCGGRDVVQRHNDLAVRCPRPGPQRRAYVQVRWQGDRMAFPKCFATLLESVVAHGICESDAPRRRAAAVEWWSTATHTPFTRNLNRHVRRVRGPELRHTRCVFLCTVRMTGNVCAPKGRAAAGHITPPPPPPPSGARLHRDAIPGAGGRGGPHRDILLQLHPRPPAVPGAPDPPRNHRTPSGGCQGRGPNPRTLLADPDRWARVATRASVLPCAVFFMVRMLVPYLIPPPPLSSPTDPQFNRRIAFFHFGFFRAEALVLVTVSFVRTMTV